MMLKGWPRMVLAALIGGNRVVLIKREPDMVVIKSIREKIKQFWVSVDQHREPQADFQRDSDFIAHLYSYAEPGKVFNADDRSLMPMIEFQNSLSLTKTQLRLSKKRPTRKTPPKPKSLP